MLEFRGCEFAPMIRTRVSDNSPFEPTIGFSRAVRVGNIIAVSGTAPIGPDGKTFAPGDLKAQSAVASTL